MICAIIPAAGQSRRMGVQKHLLPFGGTTVVGHIVDELLRAGVDQVCVVVGHQADQIVQALAGRPVRIVPNADYEHTDMLASIRCGVRELPEAANAVLAVPGDQPAIRAELVRTMIETFATAGKGIVVPVYGGRRGHPLLFARPYCSEILSGYDEVGLRGLLAAHPDDIFELCVPTAAVLSNMNDPDDYRRELARAADVQKDEKREDD
jgi:molybdenum cofactor cytidylyltransferase